MIDLTESQMARLQDFKDGYNRVGYYSLLANAGDSYGELALGVVQQSSVSGRMANAFMSYQAK